MLRSFTVNRVRVYEKICKRVHWSLFTPPSGAPAQARALGGPGRR